MKQERKEYSVAYVKALLESYVNIRERLLGSGGNVSEPVVYTNTREEPPPKHRIPFGHKYQDETPWPYMEPKRATSAIDGKRRALSAEDVHVAALDLEYGLNRLTVDDRTMLCSVFMAGYTYDELAAMMGLSSRGSVHSRTERVLFRLVHIMNGGHHEKRHKTSSTG